MDQDLLMMLYGALIGAASRVITTMIESAFQHWLERHDEERRQSEAQERRASQIYLPTAEEVQAITAHHHQEEQAAAQRKAVGTGSLVLSVMGGAFLIHQAREPLLSLGFGVLLSYLFTNGLIRRLRK
jgi:hypothetical protein